MLPVVFLLIACGALGLAVWKQRQAIALLKGDRKAIIGEEHRMFSFLDKLGQALSGSRTRSELYHFILNGAVRVVAGDHGALYLTDPQKQALIPKAITPDCPPLTQDLLADYHPNTPNEDLRSRLQLHAISLTEADPFFADCLQRDGLHLNQLADHAAFRNLPESERAKLPSRAMLAPLRFADRQLGLLVILREGERFDVNDFAVFRSLANQTALALGTAELSKQAVAQRRFQQELENAREVQRILLPDTAPTLAGFRFAGDNRAANTVSGDYYDFIPLSDGALGVAIADVSGKGLPASLMMAMGRSVLRANADQGASPAKALAVVNRILFPDMRHDMFVSMLYLVAHSGRGTIQLARAGHDLPLLYRAASQTVDEIDTPGLAVGVDHGPVFERDTQDITLTLHKGDCLLLFTDGISEAQNAQGDEWGLERLHAAFLDAAPRGADEIVRHLHEKVGEFVGEFPQSDDMTLVVLEKT